MATSFLSRPLAVTDVEATGTDHTRHEIVELGLVLVDQHTLEPFSEWSVKVRPEHPEVHDPIALEISGYDPAEWKDAMPLAEAMRSYAARVDGAVFTAWNVTFDWRFVDAAFRKSHIEPNLDYHRLCLFSMAYDRLRTKGMDTFSLDGTAKYLGLEAEPRPHRALFGAKRSLEVLRLLRAQDGR